ncbi:MAG: LpqB family beta-propeller domain-containing protein [Actinocatenispora sp.]
MTEVRPARRLRCVSLVLTGVVLVTVGLLSGCGVPSSGPPVVVSRAPVNGSSDDAPHRFPQVLLPSRGTNPRDLVDQFFMAAGADPRPDQLRDNVRQFFTPSSRDSWEPDLAGMTLVRITGYQTGQQQSSGASGSPDPDPSASGDAQGSPATTATATVDVTGNLVGLLTPNGTVQPLPSGQSDTYHEKFELEKINEIWRIANPPAETLLSTDAISSEYDAVTVYFVSPDQRTLVPDLRYLPATMRPEKRRTVLVDALLDGPSRWLGQAAVSAIPDRTKRRGNVVSSNNGLIVNLTSDASDANDPVLMSAQLAWTLRTVMGGWMQIRVEGRVLKVPGLSGTDADWETWRSYNVATRSADSEGYYVSGGHVTTVDPDDPLPLPLADPAAARIDSNVLRAALSVDSQRVAVVRQGPHREQLWLGRLGRGRNSTTFTQAANLDGASLIGRPSFLTGTGGVLVPVDGELRSVASSGASSAVDFAGPDPIGEVTDVSVSPEGTRVALVVGGHLYVAPLILTGGGDHVVVGPLRHLAQGFTRISAVAWTEDTRVVFGGRGTTSAGPLSPGAQGGAWSFSVDNVFSDLLTGADDNAVPTQIASSTSDAFKGSPHGKVLLTAHRQILSVTGNLVGPPHGAAEAPTGSEPFFPA